MIKVFGVPLKRCPCCCLAPLGLLGSQSPVSKVSVLEELGGLLLLAGLVGLELLAAVVVVGCLGGGEKTDFELGGGGAKVERAGM